jgi:alpha-L-fucosidase 2
LGGAWLAVQLWDHWCFTQDRSFLTRAYPLMLSAAIFFVDVLIEDPQTGFLTVIPSFSPENAPKSRNGVKWTRGTTMDAQILRDLFDAVKQAAKILEKQKQDRASLEAIEDCRNRLTPLQIGKWMGNGMVGTLDGWRSCPFNLHESSEADLCDSWRELCGRNVSKPI